MALHSEASTGFACRGSSSHFTVLVGRVADPVDAGIVADAVVRGVCKDDLVVLVGTVLGNPVRVQHSKGAQSTTNTLLGLRPEVASGLQLVDTH